MLIPGVPVLRGWGKGESIRQDTLPQPFPFLSGNQAIFTCGREALYFGLRLLEKLPETAHIPGYCCRSVLTPFKKLGIKIKFYDVGKHLEPIINKNVLKEGDLFFIIHYFGIPQPLSSIKLLCDQLGLILIEDCAHALPDPETRRPMGCTGVFSIYSLRKQLPVPDGGILVVNKTALKSRLQVTPKIKLRNTSKKKSLVMFFDKAAFWAGWPNTLKIKDALRGKVASTEQVFYSKILNNDSIPEISYTTAKTLAHINFKKIAKIRRENYYWLANKLNDIPQISFPFPKLPDGAVPQGLPILVEDARNVCTAMRGKGIGVDQWPANEFPDIEKKNFPRAYYWNNHLLLLPIHQDLSLRHLEYCAKVLVGIL
ncbi:Perosamine synthase [Dissulfuribacter thermophilus]|uniref:Perosamine synthase n=1 Tax=Dissulfuribacter thermophilus TaxID=1156395 RepID=A0A1B9F4J5_9BACT|nr:DegT/DnrJ/EryC1/StrS family aminotransferase [Dissulfuribacter thermophilus]OCC14661.1 Perosamine synthase [Dissulfuribacter thermophilus]